MAEPVGVEEKTESDCCSNSAQATCCEPEAKGECCGAEREAGTCGCAAQAAVPEDPDALREEVRNRYAAAATAASAEPGSGQWAAPLSLGCGNPTAVADLHEGETVLDLGSGGGLDVLLSARRVGPSGRAYGLDMTDEMLELARRNQAEAGVENAEFVKGTIEEVPLPDDSVDVIISNCVINLSADKAAVLREAARVLRPGGRLAVTDIVADPGMSEATRRDMQQWTGCIAGALTSEDFERELAAAGFLDVEIRETHRVHDHAGSTIVRARLAR